ncbi:MAG: chromosomal replication initiator protein DnaA [Pseudomonadota bacterium]
MRDSNNTWQDQPPKLDSLWNKVLATALRELGKEETNKWLVPVKLEAVQGNLVMLTAATSFHADWVERNYGLHLLRYFQAHCETVRRITVTVQQNAALSEQDLGLPAPDAAPEDKPDMAARERLEATSTLQSAPLDPRFTFDSFVVGKPNELAYAAARRVAESSDAAFNPIFLYGGVGLGKTHLMHAIGWRLHKTRPNCKVLYLSAEQFMYRFVQALRFRDTITFKQQFRAIDVLMIDDVQFIAGKDSTQEEFFHTFNALIDQKKQIVISADRSPDQIDGLQNRITSRLQWGLVVDIHPTDYELRLGILQSKAERIMAEDPSVDIEQKVLEFLAHRVSSNVRVLEGALTRLFAFATLVNRPINLDMVQECLADLLRSSERKVTIEEIKRRVAEHYNLRMSDLISARRARAVARPRQVAMFLCKSLTSKSLPEIGRGFGGRDHTTVIHAVRKIEELRATDSQLNEDIELLRRMLEG